MEIILVVSKGYNEYPKGVSKQADFLFLFLPDAPTVALSFGSNLDPNNIAEGNDVYFECKISANPDVYKVVWLHNVSFES